MTTRPPNPPSLPEYMTWEELEQLPEEIAGQIELWNGRVIRVRRGPAAHQDYTVELRNALLRCARLSMSTRPERCWRVSTETNVFFGRSGKSDFVTPDFLVYRCLADRYQDIRAADVLLVGEVLSPSHRFSDIEARKARYASARIPWYWEIALAPGTASTHGIEIVRTHGLNTAKAELPENIRPLHPTAYRLVAEWIPGNTDAIRFEYPFPIDIPWQELEP